MSVSKMESFLPLEIGIHVMFQAEQHKSDLLLDIQIPVFLEAAMQQLFDLGGEVSTRLF